MGCRPGSAADFELDVGFEVIGHRLADRRGIKLDGLAVLENEMTVDGEVGLFDLHFDTTVAGCRDDTAQLGSAPVIAVLTSALMAIVRAAWSAWDSFFAPVISMETKWEAPSPSDGIRFAKSMHDSVKASAN